MTTSVVAPTIPSSAPNIADLIMFFIRVILYRVLTDLSTPN